MQKLKRVLLRMRTENSGSVLVGAVAIAVIMAIGCIGFLWLMATSQNNEITALENERAYRAAESGIWLGARWLRDPANGLGTATAGATLKPFGTNPVTIDNMDVYITIPVINNTPVAQIVAEVFYDRSGTHQKVTSTFKKRLTVSEARIQNLGAYCTFYEGYQPPEPGVWDITRWHGWFGRIFRGRFHMNNMYNEIAGLGAPGNGINSVVFTGPVTIARPTDAIALTHYTNNYSTLYGGTGHFGNNYDKGVWVEDASSNGGAWTVFTPATFDQVFLDTYVADVEPIDLNVGRTDATAILNDGTILAANKISLTASDDIGYGPADYRPTLYFNGTTATYQYRLGGVYQTPATYNNFNGKIFLSNNNLNVYTTASGATGSFTIATIPGKSIVPVGNIVTSDYNPALGENAIPGTSTNMIGLISGQYIYFNKTWIKHFNTDGANITEYVSSRVTGGGAPGPADGNGTLHISASIVAIKTFTDHGLTMKGCEFWDGWWDISNNHAGYSGTFTDANCHLEDYNYQLYGNHILRGYVNTIGDHERYGCNGTLEFIPDPRMVYKFTQPPGFPRQIKTQTGLFVLELASWAESNKYL
jgi:hypothetical protein